MKPTSALLKNRHATSCFAWALILLVVHVNAEWAAQDERRRAIKDAFLYNYEAYEQYAFGYDYLKPVARHGEDDATLAGFGGTIVDAMSTMHIMGLTDGKEQDHVRAMYERALNHVKRTKFTQTYLGDPAGTVSVFEMTIRYVGGLLSAFQLGGEREEDRFLVAQAASLANSLSNAWSYGTRIPINKININTGEPVLNVKQITNLAEAGTLTMEWDTLSMYTSNQTYSELAKVSMDAILGTEPIFPGLWAQGIRPRTNKTYHDYVTWGGGTDSFIEYLIKYPLLLGNASHSYVDVYKQALNSTVHHLVHKTGVGNLTFLGDWSEYNGHGSIYIHSHLACFAGGNIAMAGRLLSSDKWTRLGLELAESCAKTYTMTATGLGPYSWGWFDRDGQAEGWEYVTPGQRHFYNQHGVFPFMTGWYQMPEVLESIFYAWRITRQEFWRDLAWDAFQQMQIYTDSKRGWTCLTNVNDVTSRELDEQQSFLFAETFKYLYLTFDDPERISLDDYVFNTEAHPFKRRRKDDGFGKIQDRPYAYERLTSADDMFASEIAGMPYEENSHKGPVKSTSTVVSHGKGWEAWSHDRLSTAQVIQSPSPIEMSTNGRGAHTGPHGVFQAVSSAVMVGLPGCPMDKDAISRFYCQWMPTLLVWPFAFVIFYRITVQLARMMQSTEQSLYPQRRRRPIRMTV